MYPREWQIAIPASLMRVDRPLCLLLAVFLNPFLTIFGIIGAEEAVNKSAASAVSADALAADLIMA